MRRANGDAVLARTQRCLKNRGPGRLGCGPPRLLRPHGTEGGRREALRRILTLHALGHWQIGMPCEDHSPAHASKPRDARHLDRGTTRRYSRALAPRQGPSGPPKKLSLLIVPTFPSCFCAHRTPHLTPVRRFPSVICGACLLVDCEMEVNGFTLQVIAFSLKLNLQPSSQFLQRIWAGGRLRAQVYRKTCAKMGPFERLAKMGPRTRYHQ